MKDEESDCFPDPRFRLLRASLLRRIVSSDEDSSSWSVSLTLRRGLLSTFRDSTSLCRESKRSVSLCSRDAISLVLELWGFYRCIHVLKPHPRKCGSHYVVSGATPLTEPSKVGGRASDSVAVLYSCSQQLLLLSGNHV